MTNPLDALRQPIPLDQGVLTGVLGAEACREHPA